VSFLGRERSFDAKTVLDLVRVHFEDRHGVDIPDTKLRRKGNLDHRITDARLEQDQRASPACREYTEKLMP